jgi:hypothetical protein
MTARSRPQQERKKRAVATADRFPLADEARTYALVDTGLDLSVVHPQVLQQLGVQATGSVRIRRPGAGASFRVAAMFDFELSIGGVSPRTHWVPTRVVGVAPSTPTVLALIGRDVLEHCTLFSIGPRAELTLSC